MIINLKYHIASLVAVFLALAIGILIGTTLLGNDTLAKTQETIIKDLRKNYDKINTENKSSQAEIKQLNAQIASRQDYEKKTLPVIIGGKLVGRQIAIIETNSFDYKDDLVNTLTKTSGATITSDTVILKGLNLDDNEKKARIIKALNLQDKNKDELTKELANLLAQNLLTGQNQAVIDELTKEGLIKTTGTYGVPVSAVIITGGSIDEKGNRLEFVDTPIINYLNDQKIPVFGVEASDVSVSYVKDYEKFKITSIDDVDLIPGQVALVWSIERNLPGTYGIKSTAKQLLPNI